MLFDEYSTVNPGTLLPVAPQQTLPLSFTMQLRHLDKIRETLARASAEEIPAAQLNNAREYFQAVYTLQALHARKRRTEGPLCKLWTYSRAPGHLCFADTLEAEGWWAGLLLARCLVEIREWWAAALLYTRLMCERQGAVDNSKQGLPSTLCLDRDFCLLMHYYCQRLTVDMHPLPLLYKCAAVLTCQRSSLSQMQSPVLPLLCLTLVIRGEWSPTLCPPPLSIDQRIDKFAKLLAGTDLLCDKKNTETNTACRQIFVTLAKRRRRPHHTPIHNRFGGSIPLSDVVIHDDEDSSSSTTTTKNEEVTLTNAAAQTEEDAFYLVEKFENTQWRPDIVTLEDPSEFFKMFVPQLL